MVIKSIRPSRFDAMAHPLFEAQPFRLQATGFEHEPGVAQVAAGGGDWEHSARANGNGTGKWVSLTAVTPEMAHGLNQRGSDWIVK